MARSYRLVRPEGHFATRRGIGFLEEITTQEAGSRLDAKMAFEALNAKRDIELRTRFDHWLAGVQPNDRWFHGWPNDQDVKECFCFRWIERSRRHRLYGFLCNPQPKTNPRFQLCVLAYHDVKNDESTDRNLLLRLMKLRSDTTVRAAIGFEFPDDVINKEKLQ